MKRNEEKLNNKGKLSYLSKAEKRNLMFINALKKGSPLREYFEANQELIIDVKTMRRDNNELYGNYVMNIPSYQLQKENSLTEYYYCVSIHLDKVVVVKNEFQKKYIASFVGYAKRDLILNNAIGCLYKKDSIRVNKNHSFQFINDTYEVEFKDLEGPIITDNIPKINGFQEKKIILE